MATLVSYESSSEEGEGDERLTRSNSVSSGNPEPGFDTRNGDGQGETVVQDESKVLAEDAPLLGPTMPKDMPISAQYEEEEGLPEMPGMTERDAVRYLTQPSHPLTSIPPSPPGSPDPAINAKFKRFLELKARGIHFNEDLAEKTTFRNPNLLSTLLGRAGMAADDQYRVSLPRDVYDSSALPAAGFKEELLTSQFKIREQNDSKNRQLSAVGKRSVEFVPAAKKDVPDDKLGSDSAIKRQRL